MKFCSPKYLPDDVKRISDTGSKIRFYANELIEDGVKKENIDLGLIFATCVVFKAYENESVKDILQRNNKHPMAYVCRYKLVKETIYKLVPVSWQPGEEEARHSGEMTDTDAYTDTEDQANEVVVSLNESLNQLHLSLTMGINRSNGKSNENACIKSQVVSPFKIVNNSVQKVGRNQTSPSKRASPDAGKDNEDVSPSKRNKLTDHSQYESPGARNRQYESPAQKEMLKIRKDLNKSFIESPELPLTPYESILNEEDPLKLKLSKGRKLSGVLTEINDNRNNIESPLNKNIQTPIQASHTRRSILKNRDSAKCECRT